VSSGGVETDRRQGERGRSYGSAREFLSELASLARLVNANRPLRTAFGLPSDFRERLMLVVTGVNRCRYCAAFRRYRAREAGVGNEEARALLTGFVSDCPTQEIPALVFARSWAENDASVGPEQLKELHTAYGEERAASIMVALHAIRVGNLRRQLVGSASPPSDPPTTTVRSWRMTPVAPLSCPRTPSPLP
jgi:AhpD family alkylhydroperoxidase